MNSTRDHLIRWALVCATLLALMYGFVTGLHELHAQATNCVSAEFDSMEITQAIQYKGREGKLDNSVQLIARKATTIRVYLKAMPAGCHGVVERNGSPQPFGGRLQVGVGNMVNPFEIGVADNGTVFVSGDETNKQRREQADKTLNYTFVAPSTGSNESVDIFIRFRLNGNEQWTSEEKFTAYRVQWPTRLGGIVCRFDNYLPDLDLIKPGKADLAFWTMMPVPSPNGSHSAPPNPGVVGYRLYYGMQLPFHRVGGENTASALREIDKYRRQLGLDLMFGWVSDQVSRFPSDPDAPAFGKERGVSCGSTRHDDGKFCESVMLRDQEDFLQGTFAHEAGHDMMHVGSDWHREGAIDPELGWDVGVPDGILKRGLGNLKASSLLDIRAVADEGIVTINRWIAADTYSDLVTKIRMSPGDRATALAVAIPVDTERGLLDDLAFEYDRTGGPVTPSGVGDNELRLLDANGQQLFVTRFGGAELHYDDESTSGPALSLVDAPYYPDLRTIELYKNGILQDVHTRSAHAPSLSIQAPEAGSTLTSTLVANWHVADADGDPLKSDVYYSTDGVKWLPLVLGTTSGTVSVPTAYLPSSSVARIRVRVTDGFNASEADVLGLILQPNRTPDVWILEPIDGAQFLAGANVMLLGSADDLEDGELQSTNAAWYSNQDGFLAQGFQANTTSLSRGIHLLELRVIDSHGGSSSSFVSITID